MCVYCENTIIHYDVFDFKILFVWHVLVQRLLVRYITKEWHCLGTLSVWHIGVLYVERLHDIRFHYMT